MKINDNKHLPLIIIMILNSILIISVNFIVTRQIVNDVQEKIKQNEYEKIWGKDNYTILKELQKEEALNYVNKLKKEDPALIYKMRQNAIIKESADKKLLNWEWLNELKGNSYMTWSTWSTVSILEFSDMECSFCKDYHNSKTIQWILASGTGVNYEFKNFPLPTHKNSSQESIYAKCVEKLSDWDKYLSFIDMMFSKPITDEKWINEELLSKTIEWLWIDQDKFKECAADPEIGNLVKKEFEQGLNLWIKSTPTSVIIDNDTWEYEMLVWNVTAEELKGIIAKYSE
jgi:protein-disulfide isomerase